MIVSVGGLAAEMGVQPGDQLLGVNGHPVRDVIDVQFHAAEPELDLLIRRDGELWLCQAQREPGQFPAPGYPRPPLPSHGLAVDDSGSRGRCSSLAEAVPSPASDAGPTAPTALGLTFEHPTFDTEIHRCNNSCPFCFVDQMVPHGLRRSLYVKDDDYRYSFLQGNYVTLTNLREDDWNRIGEQRLSPLYVSVHATALGLRRRLLGNPAAPDVVEQLRWLAERGIRVHTQLVILPQVNDGPHLERSVRDLAELWPAVQSVSVVPVGLTRFGRSLRGAGQPFQLRLNTAAEARALLTQVHGWQEGFVSGWGDRFVYAADEWYLLADQPIPQRDHYSHLEALRENGIGLVRGFLEDWHTTKSRIAAIPRLCSPPVPASSDSAGPTGSTGLAATCVTGTLFATVLSALAIEFSQRTGLAVEVRPVENETFGDTVTVAGLLTGRDVVGALRDFKLGDVVVLPKVMFRGPGGVALDEMTPADVGAELSRPVALAAGIGEVWDICRSRQAGGDTAHC